MNESYLKKNKESSDGCASCFCENASYYTNDGKYDDEQRNNKNKVKNITVFFSSYGGERIEEVI